VDTGRVENTSDVTFDRNVFIMAKTKPDSKEFKSQAAELGVKQAKLEEDHGAPPEEGQIEEDTTSDRGEDDGMRVASQDTWSISGDN
jgi:hypothetical protein